MLKKHIRTIIRFAYNHRRQQAALKTTHQRHTRLHSQGGAVTVDARLYSTGHDHRVVSRQYSTAGSLCPLNTAANVGFLISDFMYYVHFQISDFGFPNSQTIFQISDCRFQILGFILQILDFRLHISDFRLQILDFRDHISNLKLHISDFIFQVSDFRFSI